MELLTLLLLRTTNLCKDCFNQKVICRENAQLEKQQREKENNKNLMMIEFD